MSGNVKEGTSVVGGVVADEVKEFLDTIVKNGELESRSKLIGHILTEYYNGHREHNEKSI